MLLGEPPPTQADLHFRVLGFPVRVHPLFWVVALVLGIRGGTEPVQMLVWVTAVFVSIVIHELGHAVMQRRYGGHPRITLHAMGGLASCDDCDRSPWSQIIISFAGPLAGFALATLVVLVLAVTGHFEGLRLSLSPVDWRPYDIDVYQEHRRFSMRDNLIFDLLWINIMWGLINLVPIYPLDGGRIAREFFTLHGDPRKGIVRSLWLSVFSSAAVALYGLALNSLFMLLAFGYLAYVNYQAIQAYDQYGASQRW